jgi:putative ubiquitin-RnfH superfamily antitoxin RatB of RatAB toxin-antitoxin module
MLKAKKGFEDTVIEYRVGQANIRIKVSDITEAHIERAKHYCDLSIYVEEVEIVSEPEDERIEQLTELQEKPKRTRKRK